MKHFSWSIFYSILLNKKLRATMKKSSLFVFVFFLGGLFVTTCAQAQNVASTPYEDLPTYSYDSSQDPAYPPYKTPIAHDPPASGAGIAIGTITTGFEVGVKLSDYDYQEEGTESGGAIGISLGAAKAFKSGWFVSGDVRADYGLFRDRTGGDFLFDGRALVGHDFIFQEWANNNYDISPYVGLGYRYLYNDIDDFIYLPIGITQNIRLTSNSRLSINTEFDYALNSSGSDVYGIRGSTMYQWMSWSIGPFVEYWNLSNASSDDTIEIGLQARYRF